MKQFENQLRNNTSSKSDSETIMWKEFLIFVIVGMAGSFVLSCCMPTRMEGVEAISIADTSNGRNCNLWGLFNLAFDFEHMKIKVSGQATIDGQIYDEEILQDFPTGKQYTVVDGHCTVTTLPFTKLFPCIPANATLIKSTYYGSGDHTIGVDWYSFMWEGMDISLAVTTDGCIPITEHINTSNRITDYMLMETTLGIKNMSVFDIPEPCLHCISISPKVQPACNV